ncbi:MAG: PDZ domain-containing protein, partial [Planctomycetota bacterium]|nr:PDZ domain-containing protein [Planctomycetota bacterium]
MLTRGLSKKTAIIGFAILFVVGRPAFADEVKLATREAKRQWLKGADQVLAGDFNSAVSTLESVRRIDPSARAVSDAIGWLRGAQKISESRERLRAMNLDSQTKKAKTFMEEEDWSQALRHARQVMIHSDDRDEFLALPWAMEIVDQVHLEIETYKGEGKWRDALVLYSLLLELYPSNKEYTEGFDLCRQRAHFEFVYDEDGNWKTALRGIDKGVIRDIVEKIGDDYVRDVDFKELCTSGLENLLALARTDKLRSVFPEIGESDLVADFEARIENLISKHVRRAYKFGGRDVRRVFGKALEVNRGTIDLPESVMVDEFVSGLLEPLDQFTSVIWPSEVPEFNKHTRGEFPGVGIQITKEAGGFIRVESPLEDTPAYRAGIKPGDFITAVDGRDTAKMPTITHAVSMIT